MSILTALVQWAKEQIESYAVMFKKQVHGSDVAPQTVQDCLEITRHQSKKVGSRSRFNSLPMLSRHVVSF